MGEGIRASRGWETGSVLPSPCLFGGAFLKQILSPTPRPSAAAPAAPHPPLRLSGKRGERDAIVSKQARFQSRRNRPAARR